MNRPTTDAPPLDRVASATTPPEGSEEATFVLFTVDSQGYALPVEYVAAVMAYPHVTRVPTRSPHILGVFHHRGRIVPLIDLHLLFAADGPPPRHPSVLVVDHEDGPYGLAVQQIDEVITIDHADLVEAHESALPPHVASILKGWLRAVETPEEGSDADDVTAVDEDDGSASRDENDGIVRAVRTAEGKGSAGSCPPNHPDARWYGLPEWVDEGAEGRLPSSQAPPAPDEDDAKLHVALATTHQSERAAAILAILAPVYLIDAKRLKEVARGGNLPDREGIHGRR